MTAHTTTPRPDRSPIRTTAFLDALFAGLDGAIEARALPSKVKAWARPGQYDPIAKFARQHASENVYIAVALRADSSSGKAENCTLLSAGFADVDFRDVPEPEVRARIEACPVPPSITVWSGYGLHPYWLLKEPINLRVDGKVAERFLRRLQTYFDADPACAEIARVLRLPGTLNHKYAPPRRVTIEEFHPDRRYARLDFDDWLPDHMELRATPDPFDAAGEIREGSRNATLYRLGRALKAKGIPAASIISTLHAVNERQCVPPMSVREVAQIADQVLEQADRPDFVPRSNGESGRPLIVTPASAIAMQRVSWLWKDRLAAGNLNLLGGREGTGKSILLDTLAAGVTRGTLPGESFGRARAVAFVAPEDSWAHVVVPRLVGAGADLDRVFRVQAAAAGNSPTELSLPEDLPGLERLIRERDIALVGLDPLLSRLDPGLDTHRDAETRRALEPLAAVADRTGACFLGAVHVNKTATTDPLTSLMGSRAFAAVARVVLFVARDPDHDGVRLLGLPKCNLGRTDLPTLCFTIAGACVGHTDQGDVWAGRLVWGEETTRTIDDVIEAAFAQPGDRSATTEAAAWLNDFLTEQGGSRDSATILAEGQRAGHGRPALQRARVRLKLATDAVGFPRKTYWRLPSSRLTRAETLQSEIPETATANREVQSSQLSQLSQSSGARETETTGEREDPQFVFEG